MTNVLIILEIFFTVIIGIYFLNALKSQQSSKIVIDKESKKEMDNLRNLRSIKLSEPFSEKSRPKKLSDIIGQEKGIKSLMAAISGPNPQHVIIYGPPGIGKTAAARLILEEAKLKNLSPFKKNAVFIEIDATTIRFDERGIADPLIGSVHDPIYQGAGSLGIAGIPQPKPGAVTKAHGGVLFIDEIGELYPTEMNKLLKVLEDRKVFLESSYYSSEDKKMPLYIKEVFENGLPADFRLIGATTRSPEEISPALRSRCVEVFFRPLISEEIRLITKKAITRMNIDMEESAVFLIGKYAENGRDALNLIQLAHGIAINDKRYLITKEDVEWIIDNGQYSPRFESTTTSNPEIGVVNGLAVYGANIGALMQIESIAKKTNGRKGTLKVTGIVEQEELKGLNKKIIRKSTVRCSVENVISAIGKVYGIDTSSYDIHINFPGGIPVDGPSAGISIATSVYSALKNKCIDNKLAMTGEITLSGKVKAIGGVNAKIDAARTMGIKKVLIPKENWNDKFKNFEDIEIIPVDNIKEVIEISLIEVSRAIQKTSIENNIEVLSAKAF